MIPEQRKKETVKEDKAIVLDFLPNGYPFDNRPSHVKPSIVQAIGKEHFTLLELVPRKGVAVEIQEEVYIGDEKREKINHILGKLPLDKLTKTAEEELKFIIEDIVKKDEKRFIEFFNKSQPLTIRMHQIELLPGVGKKHMKEIIEKREDKPFESFKDIKERVKLMPDPEQAIIKRILLELEGNEKHHIFVR